ncbi:GntP family permease [Runella slithyformis]|uniref:Gluconate transporter n=1 Tax=Runella slithyformis (strain ATCC 29530 / DSM 19594 / LMG 11500 / NCIMB 11436 / LSU 4) TaxID=761193 RepID=A0A7U3ZI29_RUNSL|nr:GntP family permease [Runella slithyformis]AEI47626.1 Gluconate transporter [Runella slithyformis DSM 19594]
MTDPILILCVGVVIVVGGIIGLKLHPFLALLSAALVVALLTPTASLEQFYISKGSTAADAIKLAHKSIGERIATEFGNTCAKIGILIAMAAIIGKSMLDSGSAEKIVRAMLKLTGVKKAPIGFILSSFFLTIPVFVDTVLFLMMPLAKAMSIRLGNKNYLMLVLTVIAGAVMANSFVPPSPGPLFLVGALNVPIGLMMVCGTLLGLCTITVGYFYAIWANKKWSIPLRDAPDARLEDIALIANKDDKELPPLGLALLPAVFPLVTICIRSAVEAFAAPKVPLTGSPFLNTLIDVVLFFGDKNIALFAGAVFALLVLLRQKKTMKSGLTAFVQTALLSGGGIILITAAGGSFGGMLQQTGISGRIADMTKDYQMALIPLAFFITAVVRTAQGSATVALITASGILAGMAQNANLGFNPVYLCLAIGAGAKLVPWMNDAGFWIMCKTSNLTEREALKTIAPMQTIMGLAGLILTMIAAQLFPMI